MKQSKMKRKRREMCPSPILDEAPKRTKVHAQRKFAQGSNVNSPVITPVKEFERLDRALDLTPEPVELLPIQRPNTEDFLTFLCFRGTPLLPPTLNFFNTASIVDTNGQVHEIKSESPKNGPIDTSVISKGSSGSSERPFIAFGVRKRADPIVISRQMERKRRHALALQALRRKYQEQKMAKIRAVTISKLSEKPSSRAQPVRSNSVTKIEKIQHSVPAKPPVQKPKVISSKHINITTQAVSRNINSKMKPKMCLRSFRGRFVQQELPFRPVKKHKIPEKKIEKKSAAKKEVNKKTEMITITSNKNDSADKKKSNTPLKVEGKRKKLDVAIRVTRSSKIPLKPKLKGKQIIKRRILLPNSTTLIKSRVLRSQTLKSSNNVQVRITRRCPDRKGPSVILEKLPRKLYKMKIDQTLEPKVKLKPKDGAKNEVTKDKNVSTKIEKTIPESSRLDVESVKPSKISKGSDRVLRNDGPANFQNLIENKTKPKESKQVNVAKKEIPKVDKKEKKDIDKTKSVEENLEKSKVSNVEVQKEVEKKLVKKVNSLNKSTEEKTKEEVKPKEKKENQIQLEIFEQKEQKLSQRPSRKTKEAAAIYMEILSHKLVNDKKIDDDNVSIDSFPELPNVKRTEQRENELKAKANITKSGKTNKQGKVKAESACLQKIACKSETDSQSDSEPRKKPTKNVGRRNKGKIELKSSEIDYIKSATKTQPVQKSEERSKSELDAVVKTRSKTTTDASKDEFHKSIKKESKDLLKKENKGDEEKIKNEKPKQDDKTVEIKGDCKKLNVKKEEINVLKEEKLKVEEATEDSSDSNECLANIPKKANKLSLNKTILEKDIPEKTKKITDMKPQGNPINKKPFRLMSDSDDECLANLSRYNDLKKEELKRQTRHSKLRSKQTDSNDSEDSFHVEVKIPRKKQVTRSRSSKISVTSRAKSVARHNEGNDTDESEESRVSSKKIAKNKSNIKKEGSKVSGSFSDSDEEPLSKFTRSKDEEKTAEKLKEDILRKQKALIESPPQKNKTKKTKHKEKVNNESAIIEELGGKKPKRECAKRPSNYLPMFSSSDDEEKFFYGFSIANERKNDSNSSLDFLSKDLGRRFGKEKVNMSNEQIEKWLKDSAMAGNDKKEEYMTFCQEIPTQTSQELSPTLDTEKLRKSLLEPIAKGEATPEKKSGVDVSKSVYKSPSDRKPIFKKAKSKTAPTVGAFSVNNESSIYAFEEEIETTLNTPFRRPSRRPSSTATSKSEDELSKSEEQAKLSHFRKPILRNEEQKLKPKEESTKLNTVSSSQKSAQKPGTSRTSSGKVSKKSYSDQMDDFKYKIPSSPSASSSSSAKLYKKQNKYKSKQLENCNATKVTDFPCNGPGELVEAPTFYPSEKEFQDPLEYIEKISKTAEQFGVCKIVPPSTFKPECKVTDDMRFTSYNQYVHKMLHRWGPNFKELMAIRKYLQTQNINLNQPPWIGGMEVDLPRLYQTVQNLGGLKEVIEKKKWSKVSDIMRIPKSAQDIVTKLDDIYCKYLLPYDTLSPDEREKLLDEVETDWAKRESKTLSKMQELENVDAENESDSESDNEVEECITKGRNMALNAFYRIARNTMSMWFKNTEPTAQEIEQEFWKHVVARQNHICVHSGSIDSGSWGYGFAVSKNSPFARHAWNLKVLTNNSGSVLRSLGPVMGVTVPTLHVGMVFSACCWYRDPHSLPWIEYLHTGGKKIWYGIPNSVSDLFRKALTKLVPNYCKNQGIWLPSDTVMLPPSLLIESGVSLSRIVQEPGQFIVVFPRAFTSSISTGYVVSESVFFAPPSWLKTAQMTFDLLRKSCEPSMFSLDRLYLSIINDQRTNVDVLKQMISIVSTISTKEKTQRDTLKGLGVTNFEVLPPPEAPNAKRKKKSQDGGDYECEICRMNLFISMIIERDNREDAVYCLDHAIEQIQNKVFAAENCKLLYTYSEEELAGLVAKINQSIEQKLQKKVFNKFSGMPTLLNK